MQQSVALNEGVQCAARVLPYGDVAGLAALWAEFAAWREGRPVLVLGADLFHWPSVFDDLAASLAWSQHAL